MPNSNFDPNKWYDKATIENTRLVFRNFSGAKKMYNEDGKRKFGVILPPDVAEQMIKDGWTVKTLQPRDPEDDVAYWLDVKVNYNSPKKPRVYMVTSRGKQLLDAETVGILDWAHILNADITISPSKYDYNNRQGLTNYLHSAYITVEEERLDEKYADVPDSAQSLMQDSLPVEDDDDDHGPRFEDA